MGGVRPECLVGIELLLQLALPVLCPELICEGSCVVSNRSAAS